MTIKTALELDDLQVQSIATTMPGGADNLLDLNSGSPLLSGMLFQHLSNETRDKYVLETLFELESRGQIPTTRSGTVNRHALPPKCRDYLVQQIRAAASRHGNVSGGGYLARADRHPAYWSKFFDLGGHSPRAMQAGSIMSCFAASIYSIGWWRAELANVDSMPESMVKERMKALEGER